MRKYTYDDISVLMKRFIKTKPVTARLSLEIIKIIEKIAEEKRWSRNQTINYLLEQQVEKRKQYVK